MTETKNRAPGHTVRAGIMMAIITLALSWHGCSPGEAPGGIRLPADPGISLEQANKLSELPLACLQTVYPNKLGQTLGDSTDLGEPHVLHPAFYGCFDWHSAVHGHWSLVWLLKHFPDLEQAGQARQKLKENLSAGNILAEVAYFQGPRATSYERTYGWTWLLKLALELHTWDDPLGRELETNLQPLTGLIARRYLEFLPKLNYPIRVGEHTNTAFGLCFAWDYAVATGNRELENLIVSRSRDFYLHDQGCPLGWEPSGYDFLSPCFEEIDLMRRVLDKRGFREWMDGFLPALEEAAFTLEPGEVSDRSDGKLVHLDGLNFSRAWVMYGLAGQYPEYAHLAGIADNHLEHSLPNLVGDSYEGGHWLGSFAILALDKRAALADR